MPSKKNLALAEAQYGSEQQEETLSMSGEELDLDAYLLLHPEYSCSQI